MTADMTANVSAPQESPMRDCAHSLKWHLIARLTTLQTALLMSLAVLIMGALWLTGCLAKLEPEDETIDAIGASIVRDASGGLTVHETRELASRRQEISDFWFVVRDRNGAVVSEGVVPSKYARIGNALDGVGQAKLGGNLRDGLSPTARIKWLPSTAGEIQVLTGSGGSVPLRRVVSTGLALFATSILPLIVLMALVTFFATPIVVRRAFAGVGGVADRARQINPERRGTRLPLHNVPSEVIPLVAAVNDALQRLDDGYEQQKRFIANAAHELRTPIAILQTRLDALTPSTEKARLLEDLARLSILAEQFLDLQRLNHRLSLAPVDLVEVGRQVTSDLAPLAIAAGYEPAFEAEANSIEVMGDRPSLERAVTNLVQNAIQHGGRRGTITVRVDRSARVTVTDEGDGVPAQDRERIFEPFHRLQTRSRGFGLGLNLVQEIVRLHRGKISVLDGPGGGAAFQMTFPQAAV
jgi:signal transduction histidine kinase